MTKFTPALVSIIIRTHGRPLLLLEAVDSVLSQSYKHLEIIVVEDGSVDARKVLESRYPNEDRIRFFSTGKQSGRSEAGNLGLSVAKGEWIGFLDDDDLLLPNHVEVLIGNVSESRMKVVYGLAFEVPTEFKSVSPLLYEEGGVRQVYKQAFSRPLLWVENYLPIQSVLFHRVLYEKWGGFDTSLDQLEDWNLWVRYSLHDDFLFVPEVTSKYRVPKGLRAALLRQRDLLDSYAEVVELHKDYKAELRVGELHEALKILARKHELSLFGRVRRCGASLLKRLLLATISPRRG
ncbi:glycosyltransferase [Pseudoteredinibacter isoporae]|uniref:glycosyltransferase n=1 Tax=Pseudoteredinibacter isoporae TaxID=570281 RepID=UPI0031062D9D